MKIQRIDSVQQSFGHKSKASVYGDVKNGMLTQPVKVGKRSVGWPDYEVDAICKARIAGWTDDLIRGLVSQLHKDRQTVIVSI